MKQKCSKNFLELKTVNSDHDIKTGNEALPKINFREIVSSVGTSLSHFCVLLPKQNDNLAFADRFQYIVSFSQTSWGQQTLK